MGPPEVVLDRQRSASPFALRGVRFCTVLNCGVSLCGLCGGLLDLLLLWRRSSLATCPPRICRTLVLIGRYSTFASNKRC